MAFNQSKLARLCGGAGFTLWLYTTADDAATVDTAGYFAGDAVNMLKVGDLIIRRTVDDVETIGSVTTTGFHIVASNDGTTVDLADALAVTVTDTD